VSLELSGRIYSDEGNPEEAINSLIDAFKMGSKNVLRIVNDGGIC
jgi:hypothetical protein